MRPQYISAVRPHTNLAMYRHDSGLYSDTGIPDGHYLRRSDGSIVALWDLASLPEDSRQSFQSELETSGCVSNLCLGGFRLVTTPSSSGDNFDIRQILTAILAALTTEQLVESIETLHRNLVQEIGAASSIDLPLFDSGVSPRLRSASLSMLYDDFSPERIPFNLSPSIVFLDDGEDDRSLGLASDESWDLATLVDAPVLPLLSIPNLSCGNIPFDQRRRKLV